MRYLRYYGNTIINGLPKTNNNGMCKLLLQITTGTGISYALKEKGIK